MPKISNSIREAVFGGRLVPYHHTRWWVELASKQHNHSEVALRIAQSYGKWSLSELLGGNSGEIFPLGTKEETIQRWNKLKSLCLNFNDYYKATNEAK